jgi:hypothetical protein
VRQKAECQPLSLVRQERNFWMRRQGQKHLPVKVSTRKHPRLPRSGCHHDRPAEEHLYRWRARRRRYRAMVSKVAQGYVATGHFRTRAPQKRYRLGKLKRSIYDVTRTSTDISAKALVPPTKLPDTGIVCRISRATATGIRLKPPTLRFVGSKVIQPAPGTKTSAHAWVNPASLDPTLCWLGL